MSRTAETVGQFKNVVVFGVFWLAIGGLAAAETRDAGQITQVTLYRGQAMVTRVVPLAGPAGPMEIAVRNLPEQVLPNSLFAEGNDAVDVRAVQFRSRALSQEPREEVRKLDQAFEELGDRINANRRRRELLMERSEYLSGLEQFTTATSRSDLAHGVLNADALQRIALFSFDQRDRAAKELLVQEKEARQLQKQSEVLQRERAKLTRGATPTIREAVLFLEKRGEGKASVRLTYLAGGCGWSPSYTFRAAKDGGDIGMECSAMIRQMTGEDWKHVELTLSTASPSLSAAGMGLAPFDVTLTKEPGESDRKLDAAEIGVHMQNIQMQRQAAIARNRLAAGLDEAIESSWIANKAADHLQNLELWQSGEAGRAREMTNIEGPSLSYRLASPVTLATRDDQQMVRVLQTKFKSRFYHVAVPVLTSYVYREAEMTNLGGDDLLAGPVNVYLDGRFVGRSEIPTVARGETFLVGFGVDPQLRARRELADRAESVQGGNRELSFKYRLVLENYASRAAAVRLLDRLPHADRPTDIRVKLGDLRDPLCRDQVYVRTERPKGILRWDIDVPAAAIGGKARIVEYGFTLEFDRRFSLSVPALSEDEGTRLNDSEEFEKAKVMGGLSGDDPFGKRNERAANSPSGPLQQVVPQAPSTMAYPNADPAWRPAERQQASPAKVGPSRRQFELQQRSKMKR